MSALLILTAVMLGLSGALKVRSTSRVGLGIAPLAIVELAMAAVLAALTLPGLIAGSALVRWSVPVGVVLLIGSSIDHALRLRRYRSRRAASEAGRLENYVNYLADLEQEDPQPGDEDVDQP